MMGAVVTTGVISRAKLQPNHHHQQTNIQFFTGQLPFLSPNQQCQSTEGKISHSMDLLTPSSPGGLPTLSLTSVAPDYLGEGCHASHQPSDASTPSFVHRRCSTAVTQSFLFSFRYWLYYTTNM